jgi:hypothetical protein
LGWRFICDCVLFGLFLGAAADGLGGMLLIAFAGTAAGAAAGGVLLKLRSRRKSRKAIIVAAAVGGALGAVVQACWYNPERALAGAGTGAMAGAIAGLGLACCWVALSRFVFRFR